MTACGAAALLTRTAIVPVLGGGAGSDGCDGAGSVGAGWLGAGAVVVLRITFIVHVLVAPAVPPALVLVYGVTFTVWLPVARLNASGLPSMSPVIDHGLRFSTR